VRRSPEHVIRRMERPARSAPASPHSSPPSPSQQRPAPQQPDGQAPGERASSASDQTEQIPVVPPAEPPGEPVSDDDTSTWWRGSAGRDDAPTSGISVTVSPSEPQSTNSRGYGFGAQAPLDELRGRLAARGEKRELLALALLVVGAIIPSFIVLVVGYLVAVSSKVWSQADKRFAIIGVPVMTMAVLGTALWLRATGRVGGGRLTEANLTDTVTGYLGTLPRAIGLIAALYLGWRLLRGPRPIELRRGGPPR
jgi:hypothetical protein